VMSLICSSYLGLSLLFLQQTSNTEVLRILHSNSSDTGARRVSSSVDAGGRRSGSVRVEGIALQHRQKI